MTPDRWEEIRQKIRERFAVVDAYTEELDPGTADVIEFTAPQGTLKVRFCRQPRVIDKKTIYSRRASAPVKVGYTYSDSDEVYYLTLHRWDEGSERWQEIEANAIM